jgi:hypothetical protein
MSIAIGFVLYIFNVHSKVIARKIQEYAARKQTVSIHTAQHALTSSKNIIFFYSIQLHFNYITPKSVKSTGL